MKTTYVIEKTDAAWRMVIIDHRHVSYQDSMVGTVRDILETPSLGRLFMEVHPNASELTFADSVTIEDVPAKHRALFLEVRNRQRIEDIDRLTKEHFWMLADIGVLATRAQETLKRINELRRTSL